MSLPQRIASFTVMSLCLLGLSVATAVRAAEPIAPPLLSATFTIPAVIASALPTLSGTEPAAIPAAPIAPRFASLEDAVAAQDAGEGVSTGPSAEDIACLAGAIYFEAKGEPLSGQLAVANVIINRASSGRFPSDVCGVVTQRGQFSFVHGGHVPAIDAAARGYRTAVAMARVALAKAWDSPAPRALFFHARRVGMGRGVQVASIGNHIFYR